MTTYRTNRKKIFGHPSTVLAVYLWVLNGLQDRLTDHHENWYIYVGFQGEA